MSNENIVCRKSESLDGWYLIERDVESVLSMEERRDPSLGRYWRVLNSARISDADVEGTAAEMLEIAEAIERRSTAGAKRCAVNATDPATVRLWSPRNSQRHGEITRAQAEALAASIRAATSEPSR